MNIMIVEDDPIDLKLMTAILGSGGHYVSSETSAEKLIAAIKAAQPEVILLDLKLPGVDGLTLARFLRHDPATRHIPIVAVTAAVGQFSREEALAAGCDAYIVKPVDTRKLDGQIVAAAREATREP